jgi:hypothetical protein
MAGLEVQGSGRHGTTQPISGNDNSPDLPRAPNDSPAGIIRDVPNAIVSWMSSIPAMGLVFSGQETPFSSLEAPSTALDRVEEFR